MIDLSILKNTAAQIKIFDLQGQEIYALNKLTISANTSIDISSLAAGNYILNIISSEGLISKKFIKN